MAYSFVVSDHIRNLSPEWHTQTAGNEVMNSGNIGVVEKSEIDNVKSFYLIVSEEGRAVFLMYFQLLSVRPVHFNLGEKKFQQFALSTALNLVKPTLLIAGNLFRHDTVFFSFTDPVLSNIKKAILYQEAVNYLVKYTNASGIFLKDVPPDIAGEVKKDTSFTAFENDISMELEIPGHWHSFRDYEKELKHKYLQRCKKIRRSFDGIAIRELAEEELGKYSSEIYELYLQVTRKQIVSMGILNSRFIENLKKSLQNSYRVYGFFLDQKLIAFSSVILHDGEYDMNYIGIDYKYNHSHNLYFNILFHCLENAIATNSTKLVLGRTAPEAKAILGCTPDYRFSFHKLRNTVVNWFFQRVSKSFSEQQGEHWKTRHPFKSTFYEQGVGEEE